MDKILEARRLSKRFGKVYALRGVSLDIRRGEVHILLGENGAGKTTLAKIIAGIYLPDSGDIIIGGRRVTIRNTLEALKNGIAMVNQYPKLIESMKTIENISIPLGRYGLLRGIRDIYEDTLRIVERYGVNVKLDRYVSELSFSEKQRSEILKAIMSNARLIIFDEPTTLLPRRERERIYEYILRARDEGRGILFVTHKLREALMLGDRITILKDGVKVATLERDGLDEDKLIKLVFNTGGNRDQDYFKEYRHRVGGRSRILEVRGGEIRDDEGNVVVRGLNLKIYGGEILGIAGIAGNGQRELAEAIYGIRRLSRGWIHRDRIKIGYIPDNLLEAVILDMSIIENFKLRIWDRDKRIRELIEHWRDKLRITMDNPSQRVGELSGGNIQKIVLARELSLNPELLIAVNPSKSLDYISSRIIYREFIDYVSNGGALLLISEDLDEVMALSDRIGVLSNRGLTILGDRTSIEREMVEEVMVR